MVSPEEASTRKPPTCVDKIQVPIKSIYLCFTCQFFSSYFKNTFKIPY